MNVPQKRFLWLFAVLWAASIFATSSGLVTIGELTSLVSKPWGGRLSEIQVRSAWLVVWWVFVKGWHATEFAILFLLVRKAFPTRTWIAISLAGLYAISDELHQLFVPYRGCRASDVCIDWIGIAAAWALTSGLLLRLKRRPIVLLACAIAWIGLLFVLSVYPFGLISLGRSTSGGPFRP